MVLSNLRGMTEPIGLWRLIEAQLSAFPIEDRLPMEASVSRRPFWKMAIAASLLASMVVPTNLVLFGAQKNVLMMKASTQDFLTYRDSGRRLDITSRDPEIVRHWFDSRLTFEVPKLEPKLADFDLLGGRLCWLLDRRLASFAYGGDNHSLALYVMMAYNIPLADSRFDPALGVSLLFHEFDNLWTVIWRSGSLVYAVVSDLPQEDLSTFIADLVRSQMNVSLAVGSVKVRSVHTAQHPPHKLTANQIVSTSFPASPA